MMSWIYVCLLLALALAFGIAATALDARPAGRFPDGLMSRDVRVVDGDTIELRVNGLPYSVRLHGIDAPEMGQPGWRGGETVDLGRRAADELRRLVRYEIVTCVFVEWDRYNRVVGKCATAGEPDLGAAMVRAGWALNYERYGGRYAGAEHAAREAEIGMWSWTFDDPAEWRRAQRSGRRSAFAGDFSVARPAWP